MHTGKSRMILDILSLLLFVFGGRFLFLMYLERRRDVLYDSAGQEKQDKRRVIVMIGDLTISGSPNNSDYAHHAIPSGRLKPAMPSPRTIRQIRSIKPLVFPGTRSHSAATAS
jgi:hypothetical protein